MGLVADNADHPKSKPRDVPEFPKDGPSKVSSQNDGKEIANEPIEMESQTELLEVKSYSSEEDERKAAAKVQLAKNAKDDGLKTLSNRLLNEVITTYSQTEAATEAKRLLENQ